MVTSVYETDEAAESALGTEPSLMKMLPRIIVSTLVYFLLSGIVGTWMMDMIGADWFPHGFYMGWFILLGPVYGLMIGFKPHPLYDIYLLGTAVCLPLWWLYIYGRQHFVAILLTLFWLGFGVLVQLLAFSG